MHSVSVATTALPALPPPSSGRQSRAAGHVEALRMSGATRRNVRRSRWIADESMNVQIETSVAVVQVRPLQRDGVDKLDDARG